MRKKKLSIALASYQGVMQLQGGPRTQILQTKTGLEQLGVSIRLFDPWEQTGRDSFDLVHLFGANVGTYALARNLHINGIPFVVTPIFFSRRSVALVRTALQVARTIRRGYRGFNTDFTIMADICSWASRVLPNTEAEARLFREGLGVPEEKIRVVPNGVEARFARASRTLFDKKFNVRNFVLNVGHIGPERKNVYRLLQALAGMNTSAVIIGRIEQSAAGQRCLDLAMQNPRVTILDALPHESPLLASAYAACDAFVLPSQFETPGIAALEAGLAGARIVITGEGGTREYFGDRATYVRHDSVEDIRRGIESSLRKPADPELPIILGKKFLWPAIAEHTLDVYRSLVVT